MQCSLQQLSHGMAWHGMAWHVMSYSAALLEKHGPCSTATTVKQSSVCQTQSTYGIVSEEVLAAYLMACITAGMEANSYLRAS